MGDTSNKNYFLDAAKGILISALFIGISQGIARLFEEKNSYNLNIISFAIIVFQWVVFSYSSGMLGNEPTEKYYDITASLTYIVTLVFSYLRITNPSIRQKILTIFGIVWSGRLGWFLFSRIHNNNGRDDRFTDLKSNSFLFFMAWTMQGVWIFLTISSILKIHQINDSVNQLGLINYSGIAIWIIGFMMEVISDYQKRAFRAVESHKNDFISTGLWSISRHPNYFGEILLWVGVSLLCFDKSFKIWGNMKFLISPVFVSFLLIFISGIPILEKRADSKFSHLEEYKKYKQSTPVLIPFVGRRGNAMF